MVIWEKYNRKNRKFGKQKLHLSKCQNRRQLLDLKKFYKRKVQ